MALRNEEKDKRSRLYLFIVIIALLVVNGALILNLFNQNKTIEEADVKNEDLTAQVTSLQEDLNGLEMNLADQRGRNQHLDSVIHAKEEIIASQVEQIRKELKSKNLTRAEITRLKRQIQSLNQRVTRYEDEIDSLSKLKDYLQDEVYARDQEILQHKKEKDQIAQDLSEANIQLDIAKRLEIKAISGTGIKLKNSGEKEVTKLSRSDKVRVEFTLDNNAVAEKESKTCYLQLIAPSKSTLHDAQRGSGTFVYNGEKSLYTAKKDFVFSNSNETLVFYWDKSNAMTDGKYTANVYCEGVKIGSTSFELK
ncbi:MAG: hypothetical protein JJ975_11740 [Bacteroidia bacterium]|nr:hypothetical protein [Bacteroidia bacterium]